MQRSTPTAPRAIPAALRKPPPAKPATRPPVPVHFTILVPDERIERLLRDKVSILTPFDANLQVHVHIVVEDPKHPASGVDAQVRHILIEGGLVTPDQVGFATPVQSSLGWTDPEN